MIIEEKPPLDEALLAHFGVKGMKWGVRKDRTSEEKKALAKKVAIGTGALLVAAGAAAVAYQLHKNRKTSLKDVASTVSKGRSTTEKVLKEPVDLMHFARGRDRGLKFLKEGGVGKDALGVLDQHFDPHEDLRVGGGIFRRVGSQIAAAFQDPEGRLDHAGRPLHHQVIIPKSMTEGINNLDDVKAKIWPLLKDQYDAYYAEKRF